MARLIFVLYLYLLSDTCLALYEDEVGVFDWKQQYVGRAKFMYLDQSSPSGKRIIVATEDAALAVINTRTGGIVWRSLFEDSIDCLLHHKSSLISISSRGTLLRSWDIASGYLQWELAVQRSSDSKSHDDKSHDDKSHDDKLHDDSVQVDNGWGSGDVKVALVEGNPSTLLVLANGSLAAVSCKKGVVLWSVVVGVDHGYRAIHPMGDHVFVFSVQNQAVLVLSKYTISDGQLEGTEELVSGAWLGGDCLLLHSVLVCLDEQERLLRSVGLEEQLTKFSSFSFESLQGSSCQLKQLFANNVEGRNEFLLAGSHSQYLINATQKSVRVIQEFPVGLIMASLLESELLAVVVKATSDEMYVECWRVGNDNVRVDELSHTIDMTTHRGAPLKGAIHLFLKADQGIGYRAAVMWEDSSLSLLHQTGRLVWSREEALTRISAIDFVGLPSAHYGTQAFPLMFDKEQSTGNMFTMYLQRFYGQLLQIQESVSSLSRDGLAYWLDEQDTEKMFGDRFGLRKIIVMATENGKLYGIDSSDGRVVWQSFLRDAGTFRNNKFLLYQLRSAVHYPLPPLTILLAQSKGDCDGTVMYSFNPLVGIAGVEPICLPGHVIQTALIPVTNQEHSKVLAMLMDNQKLLIYPSSSHLSLSNIFMFVVNKTSNDVVGYTIANTQLGRLEDTKGYHTTNTPAQLLWSVHIPDDQEIIEVQPHRQFEHVSSQAKVLNDGSVIYKYLNPNLVVMVTQSTDLGKYLLNVHLIDGVSGHVIFTAHHRQCSGPVHVIHSENWIIYHYLNVKLRRHELGVLELYQNSDSENSTIWSSLKSPPKPLVLKQSFVFPSSITSMATSCTSQGITHKDIILGLPSGHLISLPKMFLDPMRTLEPTDYGSSSGIAPYVPVLPINSTFFINYNQTVDRLFGIETSPSGIESTSLLFAHGIDLFFTRVSPSKSFDVLADDFNYVLVSSVLVGMLCVAVVTRKLSSRRMLKAAWQ